MVAAWNCIFTSLASLCGGFAAIEILQASPFGESIFVEFVQDETQEGTKHTYPQTGKTTSLTPVKAVMRTKYLFTMGAAPILTGWLFVYLVLRTVRWVRRGFQRG